jgi:hypothetical protein
MRLLSNHADRSIRTATIACCHTHNRVAGTGKRDSGCTADTRTHIRTTADMPRIRIRIHWSRSTRADTRAGVPCD